MIDSDVVPEHFVSSGATSPAGISEADFKAALLREQSRSLARLGPYVHGRHPSFAFGFVRRSRADFALRRDRSPDLDVVLSTFRLLRGRTSRTSTALDLRPSGARSSAQASSGRSSLSRSP
jgi:hypothetical protein